MALATSRRSCRVVQFLAALIMWCASSSPNQLAADESEQVNFNRDIRPLISDRCFECHGPDRNSESAEDTELRLDIRESAVDEYASIEPGDAASSELIARITSDDPYERMPPPDSNKPPLNEQEVQLFRRWIDQGAEFLPHWSLIAPKRADIPELPSQNQGVASGPIDHFIVSRLEKEGLQSSPPAGRRTLIRRVTLDLTGLPPSLEDVEAFVNDSAPLKDAFARVVDRLLASDQYGEHMARFWLDAARYGDTHGLHLDNYREMWPYRDAVIRAFNQNMPWDQFVVKSLAGDLIPDATIEDQVLSGFNRCHVTTNEGGTIPEEAFVRNVVDRVETTGTVFLGLTIGCSVCHDHKFDPITMKDFYSLFAFFNNLDANPMDGNAKQHAPVVRVPSPEQKATLDGFVKTIAELQQQLDAPQPESDAAQAEWEAKWSRESAKRWTVIDPVEARSSGGATLTKQDDLSLLASGTNPERDVQEVVAHLDQQGIVALRLDALTDESFTGGSLGRSENGNAVLSEIEVEIRPLGDVEATPKPVRLVSATADHSQQGYPVAAAIDGKADQTAGWAVEGHARPENRIAVFVAAEPFGYEGGTELRIRLSYNSQYARHALGRVRFAVTTDAAHQPVTMGDWNLLGPFETSDAQAAYHTDFGPEADLDPAGTYGEGKLVWTPKPGFVDGKVHELSGGIGAWYLYRKIYSPSKRVVDASIGSDDAVRIWLNGQLAHENNVARGAAPDQDRATLNLRAGENYLLIKIVNFGGASGFYFRDATKPAGGPGIEVARILEVAADNRSDAQRKALRDYFRRNVSPEMKALSEKLAQARTSKTVLEKSLPTTLVMKERAEPKPAYLLIRGQYDKPDKEAGPMMRAVPASLPALPEGASSDRLGLAEWLISPSHPLMARVTVNRFWQQCFGTGLVETAEDFGSQGAYPSHPELLDWLAVDFRENHWDVKRLMKMIVTSSTYQQSSHVTPDLIEKDVENRLLARGPRYRLDAEMLRDQALTISGLLVKDIGGPGVKPFQPDGIWKAVAYVGSNTQKYAADSDPSKVHRRSLYTFWKRTAPPPQMSTFDAPSRESCMVRRERTNTPLQALLLLNDPQYVESARHLAQRVVTNGGEGTETRAEYLFKLATMRPPEPDELGELVDVVNDRSAFYADNVDAAKKLISIGTSPAPPSFDPAELASWTMAANVVLNLDEVITKE